MIASHFKLMRTMPPAGASSFIVFVHRVWYNFGVDINRDRLCDTLKTASQRGETLNTLIFPPVDIHEHRWKFQIIHKKHVLCPLTMKISDFLRRLRRQINQKVSQFHA